MTLERDSVGDAPSPEEIRAAVDRMIVSDVFSRSAQLGAFLRYVVESVLHGKSGRIKAYTIGVEVLRRDLKFDPQFDPIVRVEATRLRHFMQRYYATAGLADPIIIDLPRGSYVPTFRRRTPASTDPKTPPAFLLLEPGSWRKRPPLWTIAAIAVGIFVVALYVQRSTDNVPAPASARNDAPRKKFQRSQELVSATPANAVQPKNEILNPGNGLPVLFVQPFDISGTPGPRSILAGSLHDMLSDAFARFDLLNVVWDPVGDGSDAPRTEPAVKSRPDYRLAGSVEYDPQGAARLRFRLIDVANSNVVWSRAIDPAPQGSNRKTAEEAIVRVLTTILVQPFGVIYAHERNRYLSGGTGDPRYRCLLNAVESFRSFDSAQHSRARECLERLTSIDATFAIGFTYLASVYLREFLYDLDGGAGDGPPLDRALRAAQRGVELNPESSRAHEMLFVVLAARRDLTAAFAAGKRAISLNRYDLRTVGAYGARLVAAGEIDEGMALLQQAAGDGTVVPTFERFFHFLGCYLRDDIAQASFDADQLTSDEFQLGLIARTLVASVKGDNEAARKAITGLVTLNPTWRDHLRGNLQKFFYADLIIDRLDKDLIAAGLTKVR